MDLRELSAFVAVVEEGGLSAAARRLHLSQPALTQRINGLERELRLKLLERGSTGAHPTEAGLTLLAEARAVLARHRQAERVMARLAGNGQGLLRLGIPLEFPYGALQSALAELAEACPETNVQARHLSSALQFEALRAGELEVALMRERPRAGQFDAVPVTREELGVLLSARHADELAGPDGVKLDALGDLEWLAFPRSDSPAWFDEVAAILRSHGLDPRTDTPPGQSLIPEVKLAAVSAGRAFALGPPRWSHPLPETVVWTALIGSPLVRRTWAVWAADSRRRDVARLIAALERSDPA